MAYIKMNETSYISLSDIESNVIKISSPLIQVDDRAIPVINGIVTIIDVRETDRKYMGYTLYEGITGYDINESFFDSRSPNRRDVGYMGINIMPTADLIQEGWRCVNCIYTKGSLNILLYREEGIKDISLPSKEFRIIPVPSYTIVSTYNN